MNLTLADLLAKAGIAGRVLVMRHAPPEPALRAAFPLIGREAGDLLDAYQGFQMGKAQGAARQADWLVGCSGEGAGAAVFLGIWRIADRRTVTRAEMEANDALRRLEQIAGRWASATPESAVRMTLLSHRPLETYRGRIVLGWSSALSWFQWLKADRFPILALTPDAALEPPFPDWRGWRVPFDALPTLPTSWWDELARHPGIYLITDRSSGKSYVGSAGGAENIKQRWQDYMRTGHGGDVGLMGLTPGNFVFSILERCAPDISLKDLVNIEERWKRRLMTREYGLNGRDPKDLPRALPEDGGDTPPLIGAVPVTWARLVGSREGDHA